jgi:hypothetical protein
LFSDPSAPNRVRLELDDAARGAGYATIAAAFCAAHAAVVSPAN